MKPQLSFVAATVLGVVALGLVFARLTGRPFPFVTDDRSALIALAVVGMAMCAFGITAATREPSGWLRPLTIVGVLLGTLAVVAVVMLLLGRKVPLADGYRTAFSYLAILILIKWVLATITQFTTR